MLLELLTILCIGQSHYDPLVWKTTSYEFVHDYKYQRIEEIHYDMDQEIKSKEITEYNFSKNLITEFFSREAEDYNTLQTSYLKILDGKIYQNDFRFENLTLKRESETSLLTGTQQLFYNDKNQCVKKTLQYQYNDKELFRIKNMYHSNQKTTFEYSNFINYGHPKVTFGVILLADVNIYFDKDYDYIRYSIDTLQIDKNSFLKRVQFFDENHIMDTVYYYHAIGEDYLNTLQSLNYLMDEKIVDYEVVVKDDNNEFKYKFEFNSNGSGGDPLKGRYEIIYRIRKTFNKDGLLVRSYWEEAKDEGYRTEIETIYTPKTKFQKVEEEEIEKEKFNQYYADGNLNVFNHTNESVNLRVVSMNGEQRFYKLRSGSNTIDLSSLLTGAYISQIIYADRQEVYKFIK